MAGTADARSDMRRMPAAVALIAALSVLAWGAIATWSAGPYARYLDHGRWVDLPLLGALCRSMPQGELLTGMAFHGGAWLLMIAAMMLPTVLPLVDLIARIVAGRKDGGLVIALVVLGYALAWTGFGVVAFAVDSTVRAGAAQSAWFAAHGTLLGAVVLAGAGAFQFSALKYRCLDRCRTPFGFVNRHWRGRTPLRDGLRIGLAHGVFCVGCCWALMLVMFVVGMGNLGWMLLLAALMAAEKNLPGGRRIAAPVGLGLLAWGALLAAGTLPGGSV
jgi:predicted metal-binding membrane protein